MPIASARRAASKSPPIRRCWRGSTAKCLVQQLFRSVQMMGCFTVLRSKKKKSPLVASKKQVDARESTSSRLPEPEAHVPIFQSAPPSFRNRAKICQSVNKASYSRARVLSAPSSLIVVDQDGLSYAEFDDQDDSRGKGGSIKGHRFSNPLPLPLPSPEGSSVGNFGTFKAINGSFKAINASGPLETSGPLPLPPKGCDGLKNFSYEDVSSACQWFSGDQCVSETLTSTSFKASFRDDFVDPKTTEAIVARLLPSTQSLKEFKTQVNTLALLQHPNLCKLIGFHAREDSNERMLVYERLHHGSLDKLLFGRPDGRFMDWSTRLKVALGAARGLAFLHDEGPFQAMYNEFSTSNIQIDKGFSAKLSGYGCVGFNSEEEIPNASVVAANLSVETLEKGVLTPKSNVWSFGVVLLELITGRKNLDARSSKEERNIVKWSRPFLTDDSRLSLIMDPRIKGRFPTKAARIVADIILKCLHKDPSERPTMRAVVESLASVQDIKVLCRYPLQEPSAAPRKLMLKSTSLNGIIPQHPVTTFSPSPPSRNQHLLSPRSSTSALLPPRTCASTITLDDPRVSSMKKQPPPILRRSGVEGF